VHEAAGVPAEVEQELADAFELVDVPEGADGVITTPAIPVDAAFLDAAGPQLRIVANYAVGLDNIDLAATRERRVVVSNTPGVLTNTTAEHAEHADNDADTAAAFHALTEVQDSLLWLRA